MHPIVDHIPGLSDSRWSYDPVLANESQAGIFVGIFVKASLHGVAEKMSRKPGPAGSSLASQREGLRKNAKESQRMDREWVLMTSGQRHVDDYVPQAHTFAFCFHLV